MLQPLWLWAISGLVLLGAEMLLGTFYLLWLGVAALCVALIVAVFPSTTLDTQLITFSLMAVVSLTLWRTRYRRHAVASVIGQSRDDSIGRTGQITEAILPTQTGTITFTMPVMASRSWTAVADTTLAVGDTAEVVAIEGNILRVKRVHSTNP